MANYSGTIEEQKLKAKEYRIRYASDPKNQEKMRAHRSTDEYKTIASNASRKHRTSEEYRAKARAYKSTQKYKDKRRDTILKQTFGISLEDYNLMLDKQDGVCAICLNIDPVRSLAVDHCHTTGKVRGLLCRNCNQGLGQYNDDVDNLKRAIEYLNAIR